MLPQSSTTVLPAYVGMARIRRLGHVTIRRKRVSWGTVDTYDLAAGALAPGAPGTRRVRCRTPCAPAIYQAPVVGHQIPTLLHQYCSTNRCITTYTVKRFGRSGDWRFHSDVECTRLRATCQITEGGTHKTLPILVWDTSS